MLVLADVSKLDEGARMAEAVLDEFGRIDALVNNAAVSDTSSTENFEVDDFNRVISVNLLGPMLCTRAVIPAMRQARYGRIVSVASSAPFNPPPASGLFTLLRCWRGFASFRSDRVPAVGICLGRSYG